MSRRLIDCFYPILIAISLAVTCPVSVTAAWPPSSYFAGCSFVPVTDFPSASAGTNDLLDSACFYGVGGSAHKDPFGAPRFAAKKFGIVKFGTMHGGGFVGGGTHDSAPVRPLVTASPSVDSAVGVAASSTAAPATSTGDLLGWSANGSPDDRIASLPTRSILVGQPAEFANQKPGGEVQPQRVEDQPRLAEGLAEHVVSLPSAVAALTSVRVQQLVQPFAMVGPNLKPSRETLTDFLAWCNELADETAIKPIAVAQIPAIQIEPVDPRVGSSPLIATLTTVPWLGPATDSADRTLPIWSVLPTVDRPFCVRQKPSGDGLTTGFGLVADLNAVAPVSVASGQPIALDSLSMIGSVDDMLADAKAESQRRQWVRWNHQRSNLTAAASEGVQWLRREHAVATDRFFDAAVMMLPAVSLDPQWMNDAMQTLGSKTVQWTTASQAIAADAIVNWVAEPGKAAVAKLAKRPEADERR